MRRTLPLWFVGIIAACGASPEDIKEIREGQRMIMAKLNDLEKKVEQAGNRPAVAARPQQVEECDIPVGNSPVKGNPDAPIVLAEFSDFQ